MREVENHIKDSQLFCCAEFARSLKPVCLASHFLGLLLSYTRVDFEIPAQIIGSIPAIKKHQNAILSKVNFPPFSL